MVPGDRRWHIQRSPLGIGQQRYHHRPRYLAPGDEAVRQGVPDQGRDLPVRQLGAEERSRVDEPEHGQVQPEAALPRSGRLVPFMG